MLLLLLLQCSKSTRPRKSHNIDPEVIHVPPVQYLPTKAKRKGIRDLVRGEGSMYIPTGTPTYVVESLLLVSFNPILPDVCMLGR